MEWTLYLTVVALAGHPLEGDFNKFVTATGSFKTPQQCEGQKHAVLRVLKSARPRAEVSLDCRPFSATSGDSGRKGGATSISH